MSTLRGSSRAHKKGACLNKGSACQAKRWTARACVSGWARLVRQSQAPSRGFHTVLTVEGDHVTGLNELSAPPHRHVHPCWRLESDA